MNTAGTRAAVLASLTLSFLLFSAVAAAQTGLYGSNVVVSTSNTVTISSSGTGTVDNTGTTGVSATITGLTGVSNAVVTTQTLSGPSTGVSKLSVGSVYFDLSVTLPVGTTAPAGATVNVCFTSPTVKAGDTLQYWTGSSWGTATGTTINGDKICGNVPLSALTGTNFAIAPPPNYTIYYLAGGIAAFVIIAFVVLLLTRPKNKA